MRSVLIAVLFASVVEAAPVITTVDPPQGFTFAPTHVTLRGTDLANAEVTCGGGSQCPVSVLFGSVPAAVLTASPTEIKVLVSPQGEGTVAIRVTIEGKGTTVVPGAFRFAANAIAGPEDYVRYLIPLVQRDLRGANGSIWTSELRFRNRASRTLPVMGPLCPPLVDPCFPTFDVPKNVTTVLTPQPRGDGADGAFLYVPRLLGDTKPAMTLHVRDLSQNATSYGTEIHLPQIDEYQAGIDLVGIPTDERYRATLRIYGAGAAPQDVRITWYSEANNEQIDQQRVKLSGIINIEFDPFPKHPAYAQLDALPSPVRASSDRIRILVDNIGEVVSPPPPPIWAFITVTDNVTQLTSTITPSR